MGAIHLMTTARLEVFSDGVIAIIITIMVLELRPPHDVSLAGLRKQRINELIGALKTDIPTRASILGVRTRQ